MRIGVERADPGGPFKRLLPLLTRMQQDGDVRVNAVNTSANTLHGMEEVEATITLSVHSYAALNKMMDVVLGQ